MNLKVGKILLFNSTFTAHVVSSMEVVLISLCICIKLGLPMAHIVSCCSCWPKFKYLKEFLRDDDRNFSKKYKGPYSTKIA